eukprot:Opistho-2@62723
MGDPTVNLLGMAVPIKYLSLLVLVVQNTSLVLLMRYSRTVDGPMYISSTAVVMAEVMKLATCLAIIVKEQGGISGLVRTLQDDIIGKPRETLMVGVPALLYTIQNNLLYVAVSNLEAATFQVTYQLKILTTAVFSVFMLSKHLSGLKWLSLVILTAGVAIVQIDLTKAAAAVGPEQNAMLGFAAVVAACISSGFAGVYFERILKNTTASIWLRNVQLGLAGAVLGFVGVLYNDREAVAEDGFFQGYTWIVWLVIATQAVGGLVVAIVVKYADNILKGFATSVSIILSSVVSMALFGFRPTLQWMGGAGLVLTATYLYSKPDAPSGQPILPNSARK